MTIRFNDNLRIAGTYDPSTNTPGLQETTNQLTGTVNVSGGTTVTGSGTLFLSEISPGDFIRIGSATGTGSHEVDSITNDTSLELTANYPGFAFGAQIHEVFAPSETAAKNFGYRITADGTFLNEPVVAGDYVIPLIDSPTVLADWSILNTNIDDGRLGKKPLRQGGNSIYVNADLGDDANNGAGSGASAIATNVRLIEILTSHDWNGAAPLRVFYEGTAFSTTGFSGRDVDNVSILEVNYDFDTAYTGNGTISDFTQTQVTVNGTISDGRVTITNARSASFGFNGSLVLDGSARTFERNIRCNSIANGVFFGSVTIQNCNNTNTSTAFSMEDVRGKIEGTIDTFGASQTFNDLFALERCDDFQVQVTGTHSITGRVLNASASPNVGIDLTGLDITGTVANSYPEAYVLNGDAIVKNVNTATGLLRYNVVTEATTTATAVARDLVPMNVSSGVGTVNPPANPTEQQYFAVSDSRGNSATNNITVDFVTATQNLHGSSQNYVLDTDNAFVEFIYINATIGWITR